MDRHLLRQKVLQRIGILVHVFSGRHQKHQCLLSLLRFFDKLFDVINDDLFLTLQKTPAIGIDIFSQTLMGTNN